MGVLDSSHIKAVDVKWPGLRKIFLIFSDTLVHMLARVLYTRASTCVLCMCTCTQTIGKHAGGGGAALFSGIKNI